MKKHQSTDDITIDTETQKETEITIQIEQPPIIGQNDKVEYPSCDEDESHEEVEF